MFTINRKLFIQALKDLKVTGSPVRTGEEIYNQIAVTSSRGTLTLQSTNGAVTKRLVFFQSSCLTLRSEGMFIMNRKKTLLALNLLKATEVTIENGVVFGSDCLCQEKEIAASRFYPEDKGEDTKSYTLHKNTTDTIKGRLLSSVSDDETRYFMCGIHVHLEDDHLRLVSTDGRRMCVHDSDTKASPFSSVIIGTETFSFVTGAEDSAVLVLTEIGVKTYASFSTRNDSYVMCVFSTCIDGQFPNYKRVIPEEGKNKIEVSTCSIRSALEDIFSYGKISGMGASKAYMQNGQTGLSFAVPIKEEATERNIIIVRTDEAERTRFFVGVVKAPDYIDNRFSFALNPKYLLEALSKDITTVIRFSEDVHKAISIADEDGSTLSVIMPMTMR